MTVDVSRVLKQASESLQDSDDHVRWPLSELYEYLITGLHEIMLLAPVAHRKWQIKSLDKGARQTIDGVDQVLQVVANVTGDYETEVERGRMVRRTALDQLQSFDPKWLGSEQASEVREFGLDSVDQQTFWVHPPNDGTGSVEVQVIKRPKAPSLPESTGSISDFENLEVDLEPKYEPALIYYVLSRAWAKDADYAGNIEASTRYYTLFQSALGAAVGRSDDSSGSE